MVFAESPWIGVGRGVRLPSERMISPEADSIGTSEANETDHCEGDAPTTSPSAGDEPVKVL